MSPQIPGATLMLAATQASAKIGSGRDAVGVVTTQTLGFETGGGQLCFQSNFYCFKNYFSVKKILLNTVG